MEKLAESLGITRLLKSQVSTMAGELDPQVADFRSPPLDQGPYTVVAADAVSGPVPGGGSTASRAAAVSGWWPTSSSGRTPPTRPTDC